MGKSQIALCIDSSEFRNVRHGREFGDGNQRLGWRDQFTEGFNGSGERVRTNTAPDGGTRIETYYKNGKGQSRRFYSLGIDELLDGGQGATFYRHDVVGLLTNVGYPGTALDLTIT